jgi:hypothetical protein
MIVYMVFSRKGKNGGYQDAGIFQRDSGQAASELREAPVAGYSGHAHVRRFMRIG